MLRFVWFVFDDKLSTQTHELHLVLFHAAALHFYIVLVYSYLKYIFINFYPPNIYSFLIQSKMHFSVIMVLILRSKLN